jgi:hypothetical protein
MSGGAVIRFNASHLALKSDRGETDLESRLPLFAVVPGLMSIFAKISTS